MAEIQKIRIYYNDTRCNKKIYCQFTKIMSHIWEYIWHNVWLLSRIMQWLANLKALLQSHEPYKLNAVNGSFHFIVHWNANAPGDRAACWAINTSKFFFFFLLTTYVYNHSPNAAVGVGGIWPTTAGYKLSSLYLLVSLLTWIQKR